LILNSGNIVPDHVADDAGFPPARHKDRNPALRCPSSGGHVRTAGAQPVPPANEGRNQIVDAVQHQQERQASEHALIYIVYGHVEQGSLPAAVVVARNTNYSQMFYSFCRRADSDTQEKPDIIKASAD
jgi:hypothetical protein